MKVEMNVNDNENLKQPESEQVHALSCDVAIDVGQVLAANQALLKKMAQKMETMESKLSCLQKSYDEQRQMIAQNSRQERLLLTARAKETLPWQPESPELNSNYYAKFSITDKIFRPWRMRRN